MRRRQLKRSLEYKSRVRTYALDLARRYRPEIADAFLVKVEEAERFLLKHNLAGNDAPYLLAGQQVVLRELYFFAGPVTYCLIHEIDEEHIGLVSLWHGSGSRRGGTLIRLWGQIQQGDESK